MNAQLKSFLYISGGIICLAIASDIILKVLLVLLGLMLINTGLRGPNQDVTIINLYKRFW